MRIVVVGGGGHAHVVVDALRAMGGHDIAGITDRDGALHGTAIEGVPVLGDDALLPTLARSGVEGFVLGMGTVRTGEIRRRVFEGACDAGLTPVSVVHPSAIIATSATLGGGSVVLARAVVNASAQVGANVILNTGSIIEHHCRIGDHVHVAPGAIVCGDGRVGHECLIGAHACIRQGLSIGAGSIVGAGAIVVTDQPPGVVVVGTPARARRAR